MLKTKGDYLYTAFVVEWQTKGDQVSFHFFPVFRSQENENKKREIKVVCLLFFLEKKKTKSSRGAYSLNGFEVREADEDDMEVPDILEDLFGEVDGERAFFSFLEHFFFGFSGVRKYEWRLFSLLAGASKQLFQVF